MNGQLDKKAVYLALTNPNTLATVLHIILLSAYGEEIYDTDPVELFLRLDEDFNAQITEEGENRVNAILMSVSTELYYTDPQAFSAIADTLSQGDPGIDVIEPLTLPEILWASYEVELNRAPSPMSKAVESVIQAALEDEIEEADDGDAYGYISRFLEDQREVLRLQLEKLGIVGFDLPPIHAPAALQ